MEDEMEDMTERLARRRVVESSQRGIGFHMSFHVQLIIVVTVLGTAGYAIYLVRGTLPLLGYLLLWAIGIGIVLGIVFGLVALLKYLLKPTVIDIERHGIVLERFGMSRVYAPMGATTLLKSGNEKKTGRIVEVTPVVPSLLDLIESGEIAQGALEMVMGYDKPQSLKGIFEVVKGTWPGTHAVAGKGRSGKTRRVISEVCQALISGARITICDPHATKPDSLARALEALEPWLYIARGEQEIVTATREFFNEMEHRVSGESSEGLDDANHIPRLIVYDEWARLMTTDKISDEDRSLLIKTAEGCSKEYTGYNGFCCLISQSWTQESCGGTTIRRCLQVAFVHNISAEYAAFFLRQRKWQNKAEELKRRECLYKDYEGQVREIITMGVPDDTAVRVSEYMMRLAPPLPRRELSSPVTHEPSSQRYAERATEPMRAMREQIAFRTQIPEHSSASPSFPPEFVLSELKKQIEDERMNEDESYVNEPEKPYERDEHIISSKQVEGENFIMTMNEQKPLVAESKYTHEQEVAILNASFQLMRESGRITRSDIMERLNWTRAQWGAIKAVCDKHTIAKQ